MFPNLFGVLVVGWLSSNVIANAYEYSVVLDQANILTTSYVEGIYNISLFRAGKFNRTTSVLNFEGEFFVDLDESAYIEVQLYLSREHNEFEKSLFHVPNITYVEFNRKYYRNTLMPGLKLTSNFPQFGPDEQAFIMPKVIEAVSFNFFSYFFSPENDLNFIFFQSQTGKIFH